MSPSVDTKKQFWMAAAFVVVAVFIAYLPALDAGFIWDDDDYVTHNPVLRTADGLGRIWFEPTSIPQYYPLVHSTFWIEYQLWGLASAGYHATNILLHVVCALLLLLVLRKLGAPLPLLAAAIFALHPVHVESVAWVTERKNVLSALFYFVALLSWMRWRPIHDRPDAEPGPTRYYWLAIAAFLAALLSKTVTCSLPAVILLLIWWKRGRIDRRDVTSTLPLFAIGLAMALVTALMEREHVLAKGADWDFSVVERGLIAGRALWFYAAKLIWPAELCFNYTRWAIDAGAWWQYLAPAAALGTIATLWTLRGRIGRGPLAAVLIFSGSLVPALGFVNVYPMVFSFVADHFQYLASVGMIVLFCGIVKGPAAAAARRLAPEGADGATATRLAAAAGLAVLILLGFLTFRQARVYRNLETLWLDTIAKNPDSWLALGNIGGMRLNEGRFVEARDLIERALALKASHPNAHNNLGLVFLQLRRFEDARRHLEIAIRLRPGWAEPRNNLAVLCWREGDLEEAVRRAEEALARQPAYFDARRNLAELYALTGRKNKALQNMIWVLARKPGDCDLRLMLAELLLEAGRYPEALGQFNSVLRLRADSQAARAGAATAAKALRDR